MYFCVNTGKIINFNDAFFFFYKPVNIDYQTVIDKLLKEKFPCYHDFTNI